MSLQASVLLGQTEPKLPSSCLKFSIHNINQMNVLIQPNGSNPTLASSSSRRDIFFLILYTFAKNSPVVNTFSQNVCQSSCSRADPIIYGGQTAKSTNTGTHSRIPWTRCNEMQAVSQPVFKHGEMEMVEMFQTKFWNAFSWKESFSCWLIFTEFCFHWSSWHHLVQIMDWHETNKPLPEPTRNCRSVIY